MQEIILGAAANILRTYAIYRFMELMDDSKKVSGYRKLLVYAVFVVLTSGGYYLFHNQVLNITTNLLGLALVTLLYAGSLKKKFIFAVGIYAVNVVIEGLVFSLTGLYEEYDEMTRSIRECITSLGIYISVFLLERTCFKTRDRSVLKTSVWFMMLCIPVFSVAEIFCMWQANSGNDRYISMEIVGILVINIAVFYLYDALQDYYRQKSEKEELRIAMEGYRSQISVMQESWKKLRGLRHDLKHHICELKYWTARRDTDRIMAYLNDMERQMVNGDEYVSSGITEVDGTLNYLLQQAKKELDDVQVKVVLPEEFGVHGFTLNVILGNLLDNAICGAKQSERKYLSVSLRERQGILYIQIENSHSGILRVENRKLLSTKKDWELHGIGLENVKKIVKDNGGEMDIRWDEKIFSVKVMLFTENLQSREDDETVK